MSLPDASSLAGKADWGEILSGTLPLVDIFVPSIEELLFMLEPELYNRISDEASDGDIIDFIPEKEYRKLAIKVLGMGVKILFVKAGHKGAYLISGDLAELGSSPLCLGTQKGCPDGIWLDPLPVEAGRFCNASGAGDCAVAGFLSALLKKEDTVVAGEYAMMAGRDNLYGNDALSGLVEWTQMRKSG
jgi:sugar/nucleoside kinase (ribokinase family)